MKRSEQSKEVRYLPKFVGETLYIIETYDPAGLTEEQYHRFLKRPEIREKYITPQTYIRMPEGKTKRRARS